MAKVCRCRFIIFFQAFVAAWISLVKMDSTQFCRCFSIACRNSQCLDCRMESSQPRRRSRTPPAAQRSQRVSEQKPPTLEVHLQLLEAYMKDLRKLQQCSATILEFQEEIAQKAFDLVKEHTPKDAVNPFIFDTPKK